LGVVWRESASPRVQRWAQILDNYDVSFTWVKGSSNSIADLLSRVRPAFGGVATAFCMWLERNRAPGSEQSLTVATALAAFPPPMELQCYITTTLNGDVDDIDSVEVDAAKNFNLLQLIADGQKGADAAEERQQLVKAGYLSQALRSGTLLDTVQGAGGEQLIWVPKVSSSIQSTLLNLAHEQAGHRGGEATFYRLVSNGVSWVGMRAACEKHCTSCILCQEARAQPSKWKHGAMGDFSTQSTYSPRRVAAPHTL
jgi:hypothetical protein